MAFKLYLFKANEFKFDINKIKIIGMICIINIEMKRDGVDDKKKLN